MEFKIVKGTPVAYRLRIPRTGDATPVLQGLFEWTLETDAGTTKVGGTWRDIQPYFSERQEEEYCGGSLAQWDDTPTASDTPPDAASSPDRAV